MIISMVTTNSNFNFAAQPLLRSGLLISTVNEGTDPHSRLAGPTSSLNASHILTLNPKHNLLVMILVFLSALPTQLPLLPPCTRLYHILRRRRSSSSRRRRSSSSTSSSNSSSSSSSSCSSSSRSRSRSSSFRLLPFPEGISPPKAPDFIQHLVRPACRPLRRGVPSEPVVAYVYIYIYIFALCMTGVGTEAPLQVLHRSCWNCEANKVARLYGSFSNLSLGILRRETHNPRVRAPSILRSPIVASDETSSRAQ